MNLPSYRFNRKLPNEGDKGNEKDPPVEQFISRRDSFLLAIGGIGVAAAAAIGIKTKESQDASGAKENREMSIEKAREQFILLHEERPKIAAMLNSPLLKSDQDFYDSVKLRCEAYNSDLLAAKACYRDIDGKHQTHIPEAPLQLPYLPRCENVSQNFATVEAVLSRQIAVVNTK